MSYLLDQIDPSDDECSDNSYQDDDYYSEREDHKETISEDESQLNAAEVEITNLSEKKKQLNSHKKSSTHKKKQILEQPKIIEISKEEFLEYNPHLREI